MKAFTTPLQSFVLTNENVQKTFNVYRSATNIGQYVYTIDNVDVSFDVFQAEKQKYLDSGCSLSAVSTNIYYLVDGNESIKIGVSRGTESGFSFNVIDGIQPNTKRIMSFINRKVAQGAKIYDNAGNELSSSELYAFAKWSAQDRCAFTRHRDIYGVSFANVR